MTLRTPVLLSSLLTLPLLGCELPDPSVEPGADVVETVETTGAPPSDEDEDAQGEESSSESGEPELPEDTDGGETDAGEETGGEETGVAQACGNGVIEGDEECDGADIGGLWCADIGFLGGRPTCDPDSCTLVTESCTDRFSQCAFPGSLAPANSSVVVPMPGNVTDVTVTADISYADVEAIQISLEHEDGTSILLYDADCPPEAPASNIDGTFADDAAASPGCEDDLLVSGVVLPAEALSAFEGATVTGPWTLIVREQSGSSNAVLNHWCIDGVGSTP